jgi:hypothetical protein
MRNNSIRGQHTFINGNEIYDQAHRYGELIYDNGVGITAGMPINEWTWVRWTQAALRPEDAGDLTFLTGQNSVRITPSWGYQNFAGFDLMQPGTNNVVISMRAPDAVYEGVIPHAENPPGTPVPWTPNGFKSVQLDASGSLSLNVNAPYNGLYMLRIFYAAAGVAQGQVAVDGTVAVASVPFADTSDVFTDQFTMSAGNHTIILSSPSGGVNVDYLQVIAFVPTSVAERQNLPEGYFLSQNYPNPFNPATSINFSVGKPSQVKLTVYNVLGQNVATLVNSRLNAGTHVVQFDAKKLTSGVYFYRLEAGDYILQKRMLLIK